MPSDEKNGTKFLTNPMHAFNMSEWKRKEEKKKNKKGNRKKSQLSVYKLEIFTFLRTHAHH